LLTATAKNSSSAPEQRRSRDQHAGIIGPHESFILARVQLGLMALLVPNVVFMSVLGSERLLGGRITMLLGLTLLASPAFADLVTRSISPKILSN